MDATLKRFGGMGTSGIALNYPIIAAAAIRTILGFEDTIRRSRKPEIMADAIDDEVLASHGVSDLARYNYSALVDLQPDLFVSQTL